MFESPRRHHHSRGALNRKSAGERRKCRKAGSACGSGLGGLPHGDLAPALAPRSCIGQHAPGAPVPPLLPWDQRGAGYVRNRPPREFLSTRSLKRSTGLAIAVRTDRPCAGCWQRRPASCQPDQPRLSSDQLTSVLSSCRDEKRGSRHFKQSPVSVVQ